MRRRARLAALAGVLALALHAPGARSATAEIETARAALARAETALARAGDDGEARLAALGEAVAAQEQALAAWRGALRDLARRSETVTGRIMEAKERLTDLLGALQSLSLAPRTALFAYPGGPVDAARAASLLAAVTPELEARRIALAAELDGLNAIRIDQEIAGLGATETLRTLETLRAETAVALDDRRASLPPRREMEAQARGAAASAESLGQLAETLERALGGEKAGPAFAALKGTLPLPVVGTPAGGFGDPDPWGREGWGMTVAAPAYAQVSAPVDATVRYAGPLEGYGEVVLLEPEAGWLLILAGLGAAERTIGDTVLAGERLGDLGGALPQATEILLEGTGGGAQIVSGQLYLELRQEGVPVDPSPWFGEIGQ